MSGASWLPCPVHHTIKLSACLRGGQSSRCWQLQTQPTPEHQVEPGLRPGVLPVVTRMMLLSCFDTLRNTLNPYEQSVQSLPSLVVART